MFKYPHVNKKLSLCKTQTTRMWANAQRDGCPLFNAAV